MVGKHNDKQQFLWESATGGSFTVQEGTEMAQGQIKRGIEIIGYLKEDCSKPLEE